MWGLGFPESRRCRALGLTLVAVLFLLPATLEPALGFTKPLKFATLSIEEGLSQSSVYGVLQDRRGFLWIATEDGLNRYDGYSFRIFRHDPQDSRSLSDNYVHCLYEDRDGALWIGTYDGGLNRYHPESDEFERFLNNPDMPESLSNNRVACLVEDRFGVLWVGTLGGGLNWFDRQANRFVAYSQDEDDPNSLSNDNVWTLRLDREGGLWVGTYGGLNHLSPDQVSEAGSGHAQFTRYRHNPADSGTLSDDAIRSILEDRAGNLWVGTFNGGLNRMPANVLHSPDRGPSGFIRYRFRSNATENLAHDDVRVLFQDSGDRLWIGTDGGGLQYFDYRNETFHTYRHRAGDPASLSSNRIWCIYEDRAGLIWIGTFSGGLNKLDLKRSQFNHIQHQPDGPEGIADNFVKAIYQDSKSVIWVGTTSGLDKLSFSQSDLQDLDFSRPKVTHYRHNPDNRNSLSHDFVRAIGADAKGRLWLGTWGGGLTRMNTETETFERFDEVGEEAGLLSNGRVRSLMVSREGTLWVGTSEGLNRFDEVSKRFRRFYFHQHQLPNQDEDRISSIFEDRTGTLWLGTEGGLVKFDPRSERHVVYRKEPRNPTSLSHNRIRPVIEDRDGFLWVGTNGGGLNRMEPTSGLCTHFGEAEGLPNNVIYSLLFDRAGDLWISTNRGLSRFSPSTRKFHNFTIHDGLQSSEFNTGAAFKNKDGLLFFGGVNGMNVFDPAFLTINRYLPEVVITGFEVSGKGYPFDIPLGALKEINLSYQDNAFSFDFASMDFTAPTKNQFAYKMEGFDSDWIELGPIRRTTYTNLNPGEYMFRVKASNSSGLWNETGAAIQVRIVPPWWRTWWAYLLFIALAVTAAVVTVQLYVRRKNAEHKRILIETQRELQKENELANRLRQVDRLKDEFLANTSHELRTPLNGIIGIVEFLVRDAGHHFEDRIRTNLDMVLHSAKRLSRLVNDILVFAKLKGQNIELDLRPIELRAMVDMVFGLSQPMIKGKSLELINDVDVDLPPLLADENRLQQILHNFVGNAIKFTERGRIRAYAKLQGDRVAISIEDTGIGIPEDKLERIFDSFEQLDGSSERIYGGTGLGLAITSQLVRLHDSDIKVISRMGEGSTFTFTLAVAQEHPRFELTLPGLHQAKADPAEFSQALEVTTFAPPEKPAEVATIYTILVVDDEPVNLQVLTNFLSAFPYKTLPALSGEQALEMIEDGTTVDLVLLDVMMPRLSGYDVCRKIREWHTAQELPVILLTAKNQPLDMAVGFENGANDFLTKPITREELIPRIQTHLRLRDMSRSLVRAEETVLASAAASEEARYANTILHNIGNIITSVLIACEHLQMVTERTKVYKLQRAGRLLGQHENDLVEFLTRSPKGQLLPGYIKSASESLVEEFEYITKELADITKRADLMKDIIRDQQSDARNQVRDRSLVSLNALISDSLAVEGEFLDRHKIKVRRFLTDGIKIKVEKLHATHVLINVIKNAIEAMEPIPVKQRILDIRSGYDQEGRPFVSLRDYGSGLSEYERDMVFSHGFTTKRDGHGFGLHYCQKVIRDFGGGVTLNSEGRDQGATCTITFAKVESGDLQRAKVGGD